MLSSSGLHPGGWRKDRGVKDFTKGGRCMYTSLMVIALPGVASANGPDSPASRTDYRPARDLGPTAQTPLVVVLGSGTTGWQKLGRDGGVGGEALKLLAANYVCAYFDTTTEEGARLARAFELSNGQGIV